MALRNNLEIIVREVQDLLATLNEEEVKQFLSGIELERNRRIFVWARGRSFLVLQGFAMRLMHLGYEVHVVGEITCPAIGEGDLLIVASGSGKTSSVVLFAEKAKQKGAKVAAFIGCPDTPLALLADYAVVFSSERAGPSMQLFTGGGGTRFEQSLFLFCDACILEMIADHREEAYRLMLVRHANLE